MITTASELISLAEPLLTPSQRSSDRSGCPHLAQGTRDWFDRSVWSRGRVPRAGENVTLPLGTKVLLSVGATPVLGLITIPATSELILGTEQQQEEEQHGNVTSSSSDGGVGLSAHGIAVHGALRAGSPSCRLDTQVTITLHGTRPSSRAVLDAQPRTSKGIHVTGTLDLHGYQYHRTWTRLAKTVRPGDTSVTLQREVSWEGGQQLLLTTTALKDARDWHQNELLTIAASTGTGSRSGGSGSSTTTTVHLASPALYTHEANSAWQGEAALLTRRIVIRGASVDSDPKDATPLSCSAGMRVLGSWATMPCPQSHLTGYGAHVFVEGMHATARVAGVEFYRVGQTNVRDHPPPTHTHTEG